MSPTRRVFLGAATAGLASSTLRATPSDRIRVGFIGLGGQGTGRLNQFVKQPDVEAVAVCDLDTRHMDRAAGIVEKAQGRKPDLIHDYRKLLARKDIDAVMIAPPDHWHALPTVQACEAGKDVFVEKPLSHSIGEGRAMARAVSTGSRLAPIRRSAR